MRTNYLTTGLSTRRSHFNAYHMVPSLKLVFGSVAAILILHMVAIFQGWYLTLGWVDIVLHALGGAWVMLAFFYVQRACAPALYGAVPRWVFLVLAVGFVMLIGVMWEWLEYGFDFLFAREKAYWRAQLGLPDTMGDLLADLTGGLMVGVYGIFRRRV